MEETFVKIRAGAATTVVAAHYPLEAFRDALAHQASSGRKGKILFDLGG
ncbi:hypothetical protein DDF67_22035 [Caulobacter endophyticus]|uniref:Zinc-binding dehydrogenase n=1 Tax=Caulobacter endophyticus TaxID=2172652 RepID=A0A2T9JGZ1_9CAUL|nr:hypothetical protein DDF67_22035 [Caulobacter endophyticus]